MPLSTRQGIILLQQEMVWVTCRVSSSADFHQWQNGKASETSATVRICYRAHLDSGNGAAGGWP